MWKLLHLMTVNGPDKSKDFSNPAKYAIMLSEFIARHFPCVGCRKHFSERIGLVNGNLATRDPSKIRNGNDLIIWLWNIHNDVNEMLMNDQGMDSMQFGDVENYPKRIWPDEHTTAKEIVGIIVKEYSI